MTRRERLVREFCSYAAAFVLVSWLAAMVHGLFSRLAVSR